MTIPAEKPFSVRAEVYFRRIFLWRSLGMTFSTEFSGFRFCRHDASRADLVLRRDRVTRRASDKSMWRSALNVCDLRVTGRALSRSLRRHGVVRVVTGGARLQWIVNHGIDLREPRGPGLIISVAEDTELSASWRGRLLCRILDVRKCGPVAGLARNGLVIAFRFLRHLVDMAGPANGRAGECDFLRHFSLDRGFPMEPCIGQR